GRRYMRRKRAYAAAKQAVDTGKAAAGALEPLRREMELARKVCDVAESLGRRNYELAATAQADWELERRLAYIPSTMVGLTERFDGGSAFTDVDLAEMEQSFLKHFGKPLPVSSRGESAIHRAMGFDHRGRFDVAVSPWQPEGVWARRYLTEKHATFLALRSAVPGKATGAHIHIGPPSSHRAPKGYPPAPVRRAGVPPAMPVFVLAFFGERRQGRRRGNLKGRATGRRPSVRTDSANVPKPNGRSGLRRICRTAWTADRMRHR